MNNRLVVGMFVLILFAAVVNADDLNYTSASSSHVSCTPLAGKELDNLSDNDFSIYDTATNSCSENGTWSMNFTDTFEIYNVTIPMYNDGTGALYTHNASFYVCNGTYPGCAKFYEYAFDGNDEAQPGGAYRLEITGFNITGSRVLIQFHDYSNSGYIFWNEMVVHGDSPVVPPPPTSDDTINISLTKPKSNQQFNTQLLNINVTVNATNTFNCSLYIDGFVNQTNTGYSSGVNINVDFNLSFDVNQDTQFAQRIFCIDNSSNDTTTTYNFNIDNVIPTLAENLNNTYWTGEQNINITTTDTNLKSILINSSCVLNYFNDTISTPFNYVNDLNISGCTLGGHTTNITVCDAPNGTILNCLSSSSEWQNMARINITGISLVNGSPIPTFSVYINGTYRGNTTTSFYHIDNLTVGSYNITFNATNYELLSAVVNVTSSSYQAHAFSVYTTNSISFIFRDGQTNDLISNVSVELISDIFSNNYTTTNGTLYVDLLSPELYTIRYNSGGFNEEFYYFNLVNRTHTNITLYLLKNTTATIVTATVYDDFNDFVEDAYIKVLRYDLGTNSYLVQEIVKTNFEGQAVLNLILNDEFYKFIIEYPLGIIEDETSPTYIYATSINFQISLGEQVAENYYNSMDVNYLLSFNNNTNNFRFTYSDTNNVVNQGCIEVYKVSAAYGTVLYNSSCVSSSTSTILLNVDNSTSNTYIAKGYIYFGNDKYLLTSLSHSFVQKRVTGNLGLLGVTLLCILIAIMGFSFSWATGLILFPLPIIFGSVAKIIDITIPMAIGLEIVCVMVAIWVSKR